MFSNPQVNFYLSMAAFVLCVVAGFVTVYVLQRGAEDDDGSVKEGELLKEFERAYYSGEMDPEEFQRVRAKLEGKPAPAKPVAVPDPDPIPDPTRGAGPVGSEISPQP